MSRQQLHGTRVVYLNGDGCVDVVDLLRLLAHYDPAGVGCP